MRVLVAAAALALALAGCAPGAGGPVGTPEEGATAPSAVPIGEVPEIASIWWQQTQPLPGFDHSAHTTDAPADLAALRETLAAHGVTGSWRFAHPGCESGLTTWVTYTTASGDEVELIANSCEGESPFEADLSALVSGWRER